MGMGVFVSVLFAVGLISSAFQSDEEKAEREVELEELERNEEWERIAAQKQAERDAYQLQLKEDYFERTGKNLDDYGKSEEQRIQQFKELPSSCDGVDSTETWLYPTGEQCMKKIEQRFYDWCLSEERKLGDKGAEARAGICVADISIRLFQTCKNPVLSSTEVCIMNSMKHLYRNLIPE